MKFTDRLRECEDDFLNDEAADIIDELERALRFYAEKQNHHSQLVTEDCGCCSYWHDAKVEDDEGQIARNALERLA